MSYCIKGNKPINLVQGQTKDIRRKFKPEDLEQISSVVISCNELGLNLTLLQTESGEFTYRLTDEVTSQFPVIYTTYDMTIHFIDGSVGIQPSIPFQVFSRENPPIEEDE